jgi:hypothetical protein
MAFMFEKLQVYQKALSLAGRVTEELVAWSANKHKPSLGEQTG